MDQSNPHRVHQTQTRLLSHSALKFSNIGAHSFLHLSQYSASGEKMVSPPEKHLCSVSSKGKGGNTQQSGNFLQRNPLS